jgi:hypothetical protein
VGGWVWVWVGGCGCGWVGVGVGGWVDMGGWVIFTYAHLHPHPQHSEYKDI